MKNTQEYHYVVPTKCSKLLEIEPGICHRKTYCLSTNQANLCQVLNIDWRQKAMNAA